MSEELEEFKNYLVAKGKSCNTAEGNLKDVKYFLKWLNENNTPIEQVRYNDITAYLGTLQQKNLSTSTRVHRLANIKHYFNYLVQAEVLESNPVLALKLKNTKRKNLYHALSPEELEKIYKSYRTEMKKHLIAPPQTLNVLARKRNKVLLGLIIYQGISSEDFKNLELKDLQLREGKIKIPGTRRSNERTLKLEAHQVFELYDYINETRKEILFLTKKRTDKLFLSVGKSNNVNNVLHLLFTELKQQNNNIKNFDQVRASVITNWLKIYNKRKVQYMAGHRYVSSTEKYEASNIEGLQEDIEKYYPVL